MKAYKTTLITSIGAFLVGAASVVNPDSIVRSPSARIWMVSPRFRSAASAYRSPDSPDYLAGYLPLGIATINGRPFLVNDFQNGAKPDDVAGKGKGFADVFDSAGHLLRRFTFRESFTSPPQIIEYVPVPARGANLYDIQ